MYTTLIFLNHCLVSHQPLTVVILKDDIPPKDYPRYIIANSDSLFPKLLEFLNNSNDGNCFK